MKRVVSTALAFVMFATSVVNGASLAFADSGIGDDGTVISEQERAEKTERWAEAFQRRLAQIPERGNGLSGEITEKTRQTLDFNTDWLYVRGDDINAKDIEYDESGAEAVSLPHARRKYDLYRPDIKDIQSIDWYRRHFTLPLEDQNSRVLVEFNGGGQINRVYVNGALVGEARGTFTHFQFDITDYITFGDFDNVIAVQVDSRYHSDSMPPGRSIDFHMFGGLHGRAAMTIVDNAHIDSVFYWNDDVTKDTAEAKLNGRIDVLNEYLTQQQITVRSSVNGKEGTVSVQETADTVAPGETRAFELAHTIPDPNLWSTSDPYLYTVRTEVLLNDKCVDQYETEIGIRTLSATAPTEAEGYFMLNGERIELVGGNRHMYAPNLGNSLTEKLNEKDAYTMKYDLGINFVRTSHYETDPSFLDACDRIGLMVEEEALGWNDTPGWDQYCASSEALVKRDRNHASVVMWSIIPNERPQNYPSLQDSQERQARTKELDPSRLTIQEEDKASNIIADVYGWHDYAVPGNFSVPRSEVKSWFVTEWNTSLGKHFVIPGDSETRKRNQIIQDGSKLGYFMADERIMGNLKWDIFGYITPMSDRERGKNVELWRSSGVYGQWRDPLHKTWIAYLMQAQSDVPEVGNVLKICSEWKEDSGRTVYVISNLDEVELYYEGEDKAPELVERLTAPNVYGDRLEHGMFLFTLPEHAIWSKDSRLIAKGYKAGSTVPATESVVWASTYESEKEGAKLILHNTMEYGYHAGVSMGDIEADGSDVAWILAELVDRNGQREYYGDDNVTVRLSDGPGELVYAGDAPVMADGLSGFYVRSEKDKTGTAVVEALVDLGVNGDDDDPSIQYDESWMTAASRDAYKGSLHKSTAVGAKATITFTGTQIVLYSESSSVYGTAAVSLDGMQQQADCSNAAKYDTIANQAVYRSPVLEYGEHTLTITAASQKPITIDRIKVFDGQTDVSGMIEVAITASSAERVACDPSLPKAEVPDAENIEVLKLMIAEVQEMVLDNYKTEQQIKLQEALQFAQSVVEMGDPPASIISKAIAQLRSALAIDPYMIRITHNDRVMEGQDGVYFYSEKGSWNHEGMSSYANKSRTPRDYIEINFTGRKIQLYTKMDDAHGWAAVSVDDGPEVRVDEYSATSKPDSLFYTSDILSPGRHTVKIRVTGDTSGNESNACVSFSYAKIYLEVDPMEESKTALAASLAKADVLDRSRYSLEALSAVDRAVEAAVSVLKDSEATSEEIENAKDALEEAIASLTEAATGNVTILCSDRAAKEGELNKVRYVAKNTAWVEEEPNNSEKHNTYLKKINQTAKEDFCEIVWEGTRIEVYAKCSSTSGMAWIQIDDQPEEEWESINEYRAVSPQTATVISVYKSPELEAGQHRIRLITQNKADPENSDPSLTSINFSKAIAYSEEASVDTAGLQEIINAVNEQSEEGVHEQLWAAFREKLHTAVRSSYGLLTGAYPEIALADPLPAGTTTVRVSRVEAMLKEALDTLGRQLTLVSVGKLMDITVPYGTAEESIPFPVRIKAMTSDDQPVYLGIDEWTPTGEYDKDRAGSYAFTGNLVLEEHLSNPEALSAAIKVKVAEPEEIFYQINAGVSGGGSAAVSVIDQALAGDKVAVQISDIEEGWEFDSITAVAETEEPAEQESTAKASPSNGERMRLATGSNGERASDYETKTRTWALKLTEVTPGQEYQFTMPNADVTITVYLKEIKVIPVESVTVSGPDFVKTGEKITLKASVHPADADEREVTWKAEGEAASYTIGGSSLTLTGVKEGQMIITASAGGVDSEEYVVTVGKSAVEVEKVTISGSDTVKVGNRVTLYARILPANADVRKVAWSVSGDAAAYTAENNSLTLTGKKAGKVTVTASAGGVESEAFIVTVTASGGSGSSSTGGSGRAKWVSGPDVWAYGPGVNLAMTTEEILRKLDQTAPGESLSITLGTGGMLDMRVLAELREKYPDRTLVVRGIGYRWTFSGKNMTAADGAATMDTTVRDITGSQEVTGELAGRQGIRIVHINWAGQLPGKVEVSICSPEYASKTVYVYFYNRQTNELEPATVTAQADKDGWFSFEVIEGGDYVTSLSEQVQN